MIHYSNIQVSTYQDAIKRGNFAPPPLHLSSFSASPLQLVRCFASLAEWCIYLVHRVLTPGIGAQDPGSHDKGHRCNCLVARTLAQAPSPPSADRDPDGARRTPRSTPKFFQLFTSRSVPTKIFANFSNTISTHFNHA